MLAIAVPLSSVGSETAESGVGVAEAVELDAHAVHDRQVHAAELAVVVALGRVIEDAAGRQRAAQAAGQDDRQLCWRRAWCRTTCSR